MSYLIVKYVHLISMVLLFGTGLGSAFYKWLADRSGNVAHIAATNRHVVLADWLFTSPTVVIQPATGLWLVHLAGWPLNAPWLLGSFGLYALAACCWLPVVWLQIRMRDLSCAASRGRQRLPDRYWQYARWWFWLGVPAFAAMLGVVYLMVLKPGWGG
jgi:uncharacterized membrane protein